jgi:uncharacterized protein DUF4259/immunity protein 26 of polymorphic toxin system
VRDFEEAGWRVLNEAMASAERPGYLGAPSAARAIAASELIATARGHSSSHTPQIDIREGTPKLPDLVRSRDSALRVLGRVRKDSELRELWEEAGQRTEWELTLSDLETRLQRDPVRSAIAKPSRARLIEGSCFAVPLPSGGFAVGVLSQLLAGKLPFGYFFGPRRSAPPRKEQLANLDPRTAIVRVKFGRTEIDNGRWQAIGRLQDWSPAYWPTPPHTSGEAGVGLVWRAEHPRDAEPRLERVSVENASGLGPDIVMGALALEKELDRQL